MTDGWNEVIIMVIDTHTHLIVLIVDMMYAVLFSLKKFQQLPPQISNIMYISNFTKTKG